MKKLVVFIALLSCVVTVRAQVNARNYSNVIDIYKNMLEMQRKADKECAEELNNPINPYIIQQGNEQAYRAGQERAKKMIEAQKQANKNAYASGIVAAGESFIAWGKYEAGFAAFKDAWEDYEYVYALYWMGQCYELGIGVDRDTDEAWNCYTTGAYLYKDSLCELVVRRIESDGYRPESFKNKVIANLQANYGSSLPNSGYGGGYYSPITPSNSSSSSSVYSSCRICGGTGVCTSCHGKGGLVADTGYYTGSGNKSWIACPSCNGTTRCFNCHGSGKQ